MYAMRTELKRKAKSIQRALKHPSKWVHKKNVGVVCHNHPIADAQSDPIVRGCSRAIALVDGKMARRILSHVEIQKT